MLLKSVIGLIFFVYFLQNTKANLVDEYLDLVKQNPEGLSKEELVKRYTVLVDEIQRSRKSEKYHGDISKNVTKAIRQQNFKLANKIIELNPEGLTAKDWNIILSDIFNLDAHPEDLLARFGASIKFSTNKLIFYLVFRGFVKDASNDIVGSVLARVEISSELCEGSLTFSKFEEDVIVSLGKFLEESFIRNVDPEATKVLEGIQWDKLAQEDVSFLNDTKLSAIQHLFNETLTQIYFHLNVDQLIDRIRNGSGESENSKIYKVHLYGALRYAISVRSNNENRNLFKLAFAIRDHIKNVHHETAKDYFSDYLKRLADSFPGCIRNILNEPNGNGFLIKSVKYSEYIYTVVYAPRHTWKKTPADVEPTTYSPILAWVPKNMDSTGQFFLEFENNRFWIRSGKYPERYVDTSHDTNVHSPVSWKRLSKTAVQIVPSDRDDENCYIQNWKSEYYMFAGSDDTKEDPSRRIIFSNGEREQRDDSYLWKFSSYKIIH